MPSSARPTTAPLALLLCAALALAGSACRPRTTHGDGGPGDGGTLPDGGTLCGNGVLDTGEQCDDGNTRYGDGCNATCQLEPGWACATPGDPCTEAPLCGDSFIESGEECDDGNTTGGTLYPDGGVDLDGGVVEDGCTSDCKVEPGWLCPDEGQPCHAALCGDGIVAGTEECDDGNSRSNDGCDSTCHLEPGYYCPTPGAACQHTVCGDRIVQGSEQCDDGNNDLGDGCTPTCILEPNCTNGVCQPVCGDGVILPNNASSGTPEECDDGNNRPGDGCSPTCQIERDYTCAYTTDVAPDSFVLLTVYRDQRRVDCTPPGHPDFNAEVASETGIVGPLYGPLGADLKPIYAKDTPGTPPGYNSATTHGSTNFFGWYHDIKPTGMEPHDDMANRTIVSQLVLPRQADGSYFFDNQYYFPLDGLGWNASNIVPSDLFEPLAAANDGKNHNFAFTSESRYWFQYKGDEVLTFRGDDDVWVFVNGKLALDLGGVHGPENGTVDLTNTTLAGNLGLFVGGIFEVVVWQAERHVVGSSYRLTLNNFEVKRSVCTSLCGDGIVEADQGEECDDGNNVSGDGCSATCFTEIN